MVEGELILGRFSVRERIGRGGNGTVHRAWDERLCRDVAIKAIEGPAAGRVVREAHAAARLNHPGIVTLYELGEAGDSAYLVSELVRGPNLREHAAAGSVSDRDLAEVGAEVCAALAHAHSRGVVHRDIKPDNVLIRAAPGKRLRGSGEQAMLADFGIAAVADEPSLTATGQVVGTLAYMAPEQAAGEEAGPATDVYALCLTLYELWSGSNPVACSTPAATARRIGAELPPLAEVRPELPPALHAAIDAGLAPDPSRRPAVAELQEALTSLAGALHPDRTVPRPADPPRATPLPEEVPARPFAVLLAGGAVAVLGLLAGAPGLALLLVALLAPAALLLARPSEWAAPAAAPALGVLGLAPLFAVAAARHPRPAGRAALAGLAWAWTGVAGLTSGAALGVADAPGAAAGWVTSGRVAADQVLLPMASADVLALGLVWVGATVLLGALLDVAGPALVAVGGMVWAACLVACLGAIGGPAAPALMLTPALIGALAWVAWDRSGRPRLLRRAGGVLAAFRHGAGDRREAPARQRRPIQPHAEGGPVCDIEARATRAASRHVEAALHGAGSGGR